MEMPPGKFLSVLLADDDADDRMLFSDAVSELNLNVNLQTVKNGEELMDYLLTSAVILPDLLFLDLNMPRKNGFQCLEEIRRNKSLKEIFVIIYTTTTSKKEIDEVFGMGANLFVIKPNSFTELRNTLFGVLSLNLAEFFSSITKEKFVFNKSGAIDLT